MVQRLPEWIMVPLGGEHFLRRPLEALRPLDIESRGVYRIQRRTPGGWTCDEGQVSGVAATPGQSISCGLFTAHSGLVAVNERWSASRS